MCPHSQPAATPGITAARTTSTQISTDNLLRPANVVPFSRMLSGLPKVLSNGSEADPVESTLEVNVRNHLLSRDGMSHDHGDA